MSCTLPQALLSLSARHRTRLNAERTVTLQALKFKVDKANLTWHLQTTPDRDVVQGGCPCAAMEIDSQSRMVERRQQEAINPGLYLEE